MADRMTSIRVAGRATGEGIAEYGRREPAEMIQLIRSYARTQKEIADRILSADDDEFTVQTYVGHHAMRDMKVIQKGREKENTNGL